MELLTKQEKFILISCNSDSRSDVVLNNLNKLLMTILLGLFLPP